MASVSNLFHVRQCMCFHKCLQGCSVVGTIFSAPRSDRLFGPCLVMGEGGGLKPFLWFCMDRKRIPKAGVPVPHRTGRFLPKAFLQLGGCVLAVFAVAFAPWVATGPPSPHCLRRTGHHFVYNFCSYRSKYQIRFLSFLWSVFVGLSSPTSESPPPMPYPPNGSLSEIYVDGQDLIVKEGVGRVQIYVSDLKSGMKFTLLPIWDRPLSV